MARIERGRINMQPIQRSGLAYLGPGRIVSRHGTLQARAQGRRPALPYRHHLGPRLLGPAQRHGERRALRLQRGPLRDRRPERPAPLISRALARARPAPRAAPGPPGRESSPIYPSRAPCSSRHEPPADRPRHDHRGQRGLHHLPLRRPRAPRGFAFGSSRAADLGGAALALAGLYVLSIGSGFTICGAATSSSWPAPFSGPLHILVVGPLRQPHGRPRARDRPIRGLLPA